VTVSTGERRKIRRMIEIIISGRVRVKNTVVQSIDSNYEARVIGIQTLYTFMICM